MYTASPLSEGALVPGAPAGGASAAWHSGADVRPGSRSQWEFRTLETVPCPSEAS